MTPDQPASRDAPKFTILLPTRNGLRYLPHAIGSVLAQDFPGFELIVSDNHSDDGTGDYLATLSDPRLRTIRPDRLLSMVEHFEFALSHARGEWVTSIGDDDGLLPNFFDRIARLDIDGSGVDAVAFERAYYFWKGCEELYGDRVVSYLPASGRRQIGNRVALLLCIASVMNYMQMPQLYTGGLVRRRFVETIKRRTGGRFFIGPSPDASSVAALALHGARHLRVEEPVFWTGTSPKSTGYSYVASDRHRAIEFLALNRRDEVRTLAAIPAALVARNDLAVILYEAVAIQPGAGRIWSSRAMRNLLLAGLCLKDESYPALIREAYGSRWILWELRPFTWIVRRLADHHRAKIAPAKAYADDLFVDSKDRAAFPSLREASDAVRRAWEKRAAAGAALPQDAWSDEIEIGVADHSAVAAVGLYDIEQHEGAPLRWTAGQVRWTVTLPPRTRPTGLRVAIHSAAIGGSDVEVRVAGRQVLRASVGAEPVTADVPIETLPRDGSLSISLVVPPLRATGGEGRDLGVALQSLVLLSTSDARVAPSSRSHLSGSPAL